MPDPQDGLLGPQAPPIPQAPQQGGGGLLGMFTGGGGGYNPAAAYGGALNDPATQQAFRQRALAAVGAAMAQNAVTPYRSGALGFMRALGTAGEAGYEAMDQMQAARLQAAQAELAHQQGLVQQAHVAMIQQLPDIEKIAAGDGGDGAGSGSTGGAPGAGAGAGGGKAYGGGAGYVAAGKADPNVIKTALDAARARNLAPAAMQMYVAAGLGEGGFGSAWAPSGVKDPNSPTGKEISNGPWQLHKGGELDGYLKAGNKPGDMGAQSNYVLDRLDYFAKKLGYPDYSSINNINDAARVVRRFESGLGDESYYLAHAPAAAELISKYSGGDTGVGSTAPPAAPAGDSLQRMMAPHGLLGPGSSLYMRPLPGPQPQGVGMPSPTGQGGLLGQQGSPPPLPGAGGGGGPGPAMAAAQTVAPPGPQGAQPGLMTPQGATPPPAPPPGAPAPSAAPAAGMQPGAGQIPGAPSAREIKAAQVAAAYRTELNIPVPDWINKKAGFPLVGPTAAAEAGAKAPYDLWVKQNQPQTVRKGGYVRDPTTGQIIYNPDTVETVDPQGNKFRFYSYPSPTPGMPPTLVPIGQSEIGPAATAQQKNIGGAQPVTIQNQTTQQGPGYSQPVQSKAGSIIPPASEASPISGSKEYLDARAKQFADTEDAWGKSVQSANEAMQRTQAIMSAMRDYQTGAWAEEKSDLVAKLKAFGIDLGNAANDPAKAQEILKNSYTTGLATMKATGLSKWTQAELFGQLKNFANPENQPAANREIGAETIGTLQWEQQMQKDFAEAKKYASILDPQDFQRRWVDANPLQPYVDRVRAEIGPLKGEEGGPQSGLGTPLQTLTGPNGHRIGQFQGRGWIDMSTGQPWSPPAAGAR